MRLKVVGTLAAMLLLAACSSDSNTGSTAAGTGAAGAGAGAGTQSAPARAQTLQERLVAEIGDRVFFDFDKSDLKPEERRRIERWADFLKQNASSNVTIEGHCDERGTREYNIALGERRAAAAKNYLVSLGIDARRVSTISYGKERPQVVGSNDAAYSQNRRGVLVIN